MAADHDHPRRRLRRSGQAQGPLQAGDPGHGSAALAQTLHARGLVDEYRLFIEPVVLGTGKRLFELGSTPTALQLVETKPMERGSVLAIYRPAGTPTYGDFQMDEGLGLPET